MAAVRLSLADRPKSRLLGGQYSSGKYNACNRKFYQAGESVLSQSVCWEATPNTKWFLHQRPSVTGATVGGTHGSSCDTRLAQSKIR